MKNYPHIAQKLYNEPWLITKEKHDSLTTLFQAHLAGQNIDWLDGKDDKEDSSSPRMEGQTLILPVHGVLGKHLSSIEMMCGGCSMDSISSELDKAEKSYQIRNVLLDLRSPGGTVVGTPELAGKISKMSKDVVAFTDSECCSGALWLASQADKFFCTESALVGSCGVYSIYLDRSKQLEGMGVSVNAISAGEFKLTGASFKPMTERERAMLQDQCDDTHRKFQEAITNHRDVGEEYLQGQVFYGEDAAGIGMVDGVVEDMQDVLENYMR